MTNSEYDSEKIEKYELKRENAFLLVIDIQEKLVPAMNGGEEVVNKAGVLLQAAGLMDIPVAFTEQYPRGLGHTLELLSSKQPDDTRVFEKISFDACTPDVMEAISSSGKKQIIITGIETHVCVFQTVRRLLSEGYRVFLPQDAVGSRQQANKENALTQIRDMGAVVTNTETVLFDLLKVAGSSLFKQISALIK